MLLVLRISIDLLLFSASLSDLWRFSLSSFYYGSVSLRHAHLQLMEKFVHDMLCHAALSFKCDLKYLSNQAPV